MIGFFNKLSPLNVDEGPEWHHPPCIAGSPPLHNLMLLLLFTVPHSYANIFINFINFINFTVAS